MIRLPLIVLLLLAWVLGCQARANETDPALVRTVTQLDAELFDAYNRCDLPAFERLFSPAVEFYHDNGGLMLGRAAVVESTRKFICGKVRRALLTETLRIYPIKDFGAIEEGEHIFCEIATGQCEGVAKFVMIWRLHKGRWQATRVLSYGHRALTETEKAALKSSSATPPH